MTNVSFKNGLLHYHKIGNGENILLAFHGFGQDGGVFKDWGKSLNNYTIYAFDLFHHGKSKRASQPLSKAEWKEILTQFLEKEGINEFSLFGFSLGGRFAIASCLAYPEQVKQLYLAAPDGIFLTIWFKLATTPVLRLIFKYLMTEPNALEKWISVAQKTRIVNQYVIDFVKKELGEAKNRKKVYDSWNDFKALGYSKKDLTSNFKSLSLKRTLILGDRDYVIKPTSILPIIHNMERFSIERLPLKHHQLLKESIKFIVN